MGDTNEDDWKARFVETLSRQFRTQGTSGPDALADAKVHADDCYPRQHMSAPEAAARAEFESLFPLIKTIH